MATTTSKVQMEYLTRLASSPGFTGHLSLRYAEWQDLAAALPHDSTYTSIISVDPLAVSQIPAPLLHPFFAQQRSRLAVSGTITLLSVTLAECFAAVLRTSQMKGSVLSALSTSGGVAEAARGAGLKEVARLEVREGLGKHFAATVRHWRLRLSAHWHAACMLGATDADLRRCGLLSGLTVLKQSV
jgi:cyclopropane fatty-acyl-phospholipid synthase-like methyltransferase